MTARDLIRDLRQATLELQDDRVIEQYWFSDNGCVAATLGKKDGQICVCAPLLAYRIPDDNALEITEYDGKLLYRWEGAHVIGDVLTVLCGGVTKKFSITRAPETEIATTLPVPEVEKILAVIRSRTDEQIVSVRDGEFGPEVRTGRLRGHIWKVRRAPSGWKILQGIEWAS